MNTLLYMTALMGLVAHVSARLLALTSDTPGAVYELSKVDGSASEVVVLDSETSLVGLAFLNGVLYSTDVYDDAYNVESINLATGQTTFVSNQDESSNWYDLAANPTLGLLYSHDLDAGARLKSLDPLTGVVTTIGSTPGVQIVGSAFDVSTNTLYGVDGTQLYAIDPATGDKTTIGPHNVFVPFSIIAGLAIEDGELYMVTPDGLFTLNKSTGDSTFIGAHGLNLDGLTSGDDDDDVCRSRLYVY